METATQAPSSPAIRPKMLTCLLTESDERDVETLVSSGIMARRDARVLLVLHRHGKGQTITSHWIERCADLRQPEVSLALKNLIRAGTITVTEERQVRKGRPVKVFRITRPLDQYVRDLMATRQAELNYGIKTVSLIFAEVAA